MANQRCSVLALKTTLSKAVFFTFLVSTVSLFPLRSQFDAETDHFSTQELAQGYRDSIVGATPRSVLSENEIATEEARDGVNLARRPMRVRGIRVLSFRGNETPKSFSARLNSSGRYEYVESDYSHRPHAGPNDSRFPPANNGRCAISSHAASARNSPRLSLRTSWPRCGRFREAVSSRANGA